MTARPMAVCLARSLVKLQALRILLRAAESLFRPLDSRTSQRARDADVNRIAARDGRFLDKHADGPTGQRGRRKNFMVPVACDG